MQLKWPMLWDLFSLFPAHAGVILYEKNGQPMEKPFPRTRGGDPFINRDFGKVSDFSPHTRG